MKNTDEYINVPFIKSLLADFGDNKIYDINILDTINSYDSELLEKYDNDILDALNSLSEKELKQYILTDNILFELAYHLLNYDIYKTDNGEIYLELSDRRVFNELGIEILMEELNNEAEAWVKNFSDNVKLNYSNNLEVIQLGRSGRHICIPLSIEGIIIYNTLVEKYKEEENKFIEYIKGEEEGEE